MTRLRQCKQPEDKINGVMKHLAKQSNVLDVPESDCSLTPAATYIRISRFLITKCIGMHILLQAGLSQQHLHGLPSWCPDFSTYKPVPVWMEARIWQDTRAGLKMPHTKEKLIWASEDFRDKLKGHPDEPNSIYLGPPDDTILLRGKLVDTIIELGPVRHGTWDDPSWWDDHPAFMIWFLASFTMIESSRAIKRKYPTALLRDTAYANTLVADERIGRKEIKDPHASYMSLRIPWSEETPQLAEYIRFCNRSTFNRKVGVTSRGLIGLFPPCSKVRDKVVVAAGSEFPLVLRRTLRREPLVVEGARKWTLQFTGDAYVHDLMEGGKLLDEGMEKPAVDLYLI